MTPEKLLYKLVELFEQLKVRYFITGSVASMSYGEPRFTQDVDIVVDLHERHVDSLCAAFGSPDFYISRQAALDAIRTRRQFNVLHLTDGVKADLIIPQATEFNDLQFSRSFSAKVGSRGSAIVSSPEDVILKKMEFYLEGRSEKHLRDVTGVLKLCPHPIDYEYIEQWAGKLGVLDIWKLILARLAQPYDDDDDLTFP